MPPIPSLRSAALCLLILLSLLTAAGQAEPSYPQENPRVLVLHSYHPGLMWTDHLHAGLQQALLEQVPDAELLVEYLDTKRHADAGTVAHWRNLFYHKYVGTPLDVVITSDDNAFRFALELRPTLFPGVPIVFSGVNALEVYQEDKNLKPLLENTTGVVEAYDVADTLALALELHPETQTVYIVNDRTVTGRSNKRVIQTAIDDAGWRAQRRFEYLEDFTMGELLARVADLPAESLVLMMSFNRDREGRAFSYRRSIGMVAENCRVPIYGVWGFYLGHGIVGGRLTDGRTQGAAAARLAARILKGARAKDLPVIRRSPNRYMFDARQLERFGIDETRLPEERHVISAEVSIFVRHKRLILTTLAALAVQTLIILLLAVNIGRRRRAEQRLEESKAHYRKVFENVQDAYYEATEGGELLEMSPSVEKVLGYTRDELIGQDIKDLYVDPESRDRLLKVMRRQRRVPDYELLLKGPKGDAIPCAINATLIPARGDTPARIVGSMRNITQRKQDEAERRRLKERLYRAEKMEMVGNLAGGVAHDLNNLLSAVIAYPDLLLADMAADNPLRRPLTTIQDAGNKAVAVVQDMLTLSRRGMIAKEEVLLNSIISDYLVSGPFDRLRNRFPAVLFDTRLAPDLLPVNASGAHLTKLVVNLVENATDGIDHVGRVTLTTSIQQLEAPPAGYERVRPGPYVCLQVEDNGEGLSAEAQKRLFEPFYTKKSMGRGGTGLGMAVVNGVVEDHDGYVIVDSREGEGTHVTVYLPVAACAGAVEPPPQSVPAIAAGDYHILIVDDTDVQREMAMVMLRKLGYRADAVSSGEAALEWRRDNVTDLLLLDMIMAPGMDGLDTYRQFVANWPGTKAVIASGYAETERVTQALDLGAGGFLSKPYSMNALARMVEQVLREGGDA